jgi:hypothetical protein
VSVREDWIVFRAATTRDAVGSKDAGQAILTEIAQFGRLDDEERREVVGVLREDLWSEAYGYDALALVDEFHIVEAIPDLELRVKALRSSTSVVDRKLAEWIEGLLTRLEGPGVQ